MSRSQIDPTRKLLLAIIWPILLAGCDSATTGPNANANGRSARAVPPPSSQALAASEAERLAAERALKKMQENQGPPAAAAEANSPEASVTGNRPSTPPSQPAESPAAQPAPLPGGHPPIGESASPNGGAAAPTGAPTIAPPAAGGKTLKFDAPAEWKSQKPSRPTRLAEYDLSGDAPAGTTTVVLTAFPPRGAMAELEPNLNRWMASFMTPDGEKLSRDAVEITEKSVNDLKVSVVKMSGRYLAPASMGGTGKMTDDVQRMVMMMVPTPDSVFFLRLQGPEAAVKAAEEKLDAVIGSFKVE